jgi:hypothetical protein
MGFTGKVGLFSDEKCTKEVDVIGWKNGYILNLINGEKEELVNTAKEGETATTEIWLKNLTVWRFGITEISHPDKRIKFKLDNSWIGLKPVKLTISFQVPVHPVPEDVVKSGKLEIKGEFIYGNR